MILSIRRESGLGISSERSGSGGVWVLRFGKGFSCGQSREWAKVWGQRGGRVEVRMRDEKVFGLVVWRQRVATLVTRLESGRLAVGSWWGLGRMCVRVGWWLEATSKSSWMKVELGRAETWRRGRARVKMSWRRVEDRYVRLERRKGVGMRLRVRYRRARPWK
jgi:hypothetical protein